MNRQTQYVVVMGVSGSGKTEVARRLANLTDSIYLDADDHHPSTNVEHMRRGLPLNDDMRWPWLDAVAKAARTQAGSPADAQTTQAGRAIFIACSALKRRYRDVLRTHLNPITFVFLDGTRELIQTRLETRVGHFMPSALLDSQFADLEPPGPDENCVTVFVDAPLETVVATALDRLAEREDGSFSFVKENTAGK
ncbi:gluconokinase [Thalassospira sp. HF15]|uniref:gluconokinase n=1 Tax=Thalassospira sp. HF15 TaxID=2722755 RepID=UPI00143105BD|nr:gluconokinase [Thalassospira sp. HF15]NIY77612.1 gluconokinase [Thalassospira sp. HF15]